MKTIVLGCFFCLVAMSLASGQPAPPLQPRIGPAADSRLLADRLSKTKERLKADVARRIGHGIVNQRNPVASTSVVHVQDARLSSA